MISKNTEILKAVETGLPPQNIDAEEVILGGILLDAEAFARVKRLPPEAFYLTHHQAIFRHALEVAKKGGEVNLMTITMSLSNARQLDGVGGTLKLSSLMDKTVTTVNLDGYAELILEKYRRRQIIQFGQELIESGYDTSEELGVWLEKATRVLSRLKSKTDPDKAKFDSLIEAIKAIESHVDDPGLRYIKKQKLAREYGFKSVKEIDQVFLLHMQNRERIPMMSFAELKEKYGGDVQKWLVGGFFPANSFNLIDAYGGVGKTLLMYDLAIHLMNGTPWNGLPVTNLEERRILIIQADESPSATVNALRERIPDGEKNIQFLPGWNLNQLGHLEQVMEGFKPCFVLVDSLTAINRDSSSDENSASYVSRLKGLHLLCQSHEAACCVIHHSNKNGDYRGSTAIPAAFDQHFSLRRPQDVENKRDCRRILSIEKSRYRSPDSYEMEFEPDTKTWKLLGKIDKGMDLNKSTRERIVEFLTQCRGVRLAIQEIANQIGGSPHTVRKEVNTLALEGIIGKIKSTEGRGYSYFVSDDQIEEGLYEVIRAPSTDQSDHFVDHFQKPIHKKDVASTDPMIRKIQKNSDDHEKVQNNGSLDHFAPQTFHSEGSACDPQSDPQVIRINKRITSFSIGDMVKYTGSDKKLKGRCGTRHLKVIKVNGFIVTVNHRKWNSPAEIPKNNLKRIEKGELPNFTDEV